MTKSVLWFVSRAYSWIMFSLCNDIIFQRGNVQIEISVDFWSWYMISTRRFSWLRSDWMWSTYEVFMLGRYDSFRSNGIRWLVRISILSREYSKHGSSWLHTLDNCQGLAWLANESDRVRRNGGIFVSCAHTWVGRCRSPYCLALYSAGGSHIYQAPLGMDLEAARYSFLNVYSRVISTASMRSKMWAALLVISSREPLSHEKDSHF